MPGQLHGAMLFLGPYGDGAPWCGRTLRANRTCLTHPLGKLDVDHRVGAFINGWCPTHALLACWTCCVLTLPINYTILGGESAARLRLPVIISPHRAKQIHLILSFALDNQFRIGYPQGETRYQQYAWLAGVHAVRAWNGWLGSPHRRRLLRSWSQHS